MVNRLNIVNAIKTTKLVEALATTQLTAYAAPVCQSEPCLPDMHKTPQTKISAHGRGNEIKMAGIYFLIFVFVPFA